MGYELKNKIPDPEVLLSLEPEELAAILLPIFQERQRPGQPLNFYNYVNEFYQREPIYPREYADQVSRAIMESDWMDDERRNPSTGHAAARGTLDVYHAPRLGA